MTRFVGPDNLDSSAERIDLIDAAGVLRKPPIGGQGLVEQLKEECAIDAVVADQHDCVINVPIEDEAEGVCRPGHQVLK
jgi:hypothetical protein